MSKPIDASQHDTDKALHPPHLDYYAEHFAPFVNQEVKLLELGIHRGGSLLLWRDYFEKGAIVGLDINPIELNDPTGRIHTYQGGQQNTTLLDRIAQEHAPDGFDIIIDDCAHVGKLARASFWHLFDNHLKPGGVYAIEDWGTGYWETWPDGKFYTANIAAEKKGEKPRSTPQPRAPFKPLTAFERFLSRLAGTLQRKPPAAPEQKDRFPSHDYGMVGFIKELIDECAYADITCPGLGISPPRASKFKKMHISHALVIIVKPT